MQDALNGDLIGGSLESALNDMLTETVATGIDELLGGAASGDLMNIVSGLLNGLNGAMTDPVALLAALNALGISLESLGLTEEHLNALLGLSLPLCSSGAWGDTCTGASMAASSGNIINVPAGSNIRAALNNAKPGDTIVLACGTHQGFQLNNGGTENGWITIKAAEPRCAKVNGLVHVYKADYVRIEGLELTDSSLSVTASHHIEVVNNLINNGSMTLNLSDFLLVDGNEVSGSDKQFNLVSILNPQNITGDTTTRDRIVVRNNVIHGNKWPHKTDGAGLIFDNGIERQLAVHDPSNFPALIHNRVPWASYTMGGIIDNNIFYENNGTGVTLYNAHGVTVSNNIAANNNQGEGRQGPWGGQILNTSGSDNSFINNVTATPGTQQTYGISCQYFRDYSSPTFKQNDNTTWSGNTTCNFNKRGDQAVSTQSTCPISAADNNLGDCSIAEALGLTGDNAVPNDYLVTCGAEGEAEGL